MCQYHCYDLTLLQLLSNKLQRLGCEPLPHVGEDLLPFLVNDTLNVSALRSAMQDMSCVQVEPGVLPETQQQAEQLEDDMPEGEDDVLAAEWFQEQRLHPERHPVAAAAAAAAPLQVPVAPWLQDAGAASRADAPVGAVPVSGATTGTAAGGAAAAGATAREAAAAAASEAAAAAAAAASEMAAAAAAAASGRVAGPSYAPLAAGAELGSTASMLAPTSAAGGYCTIEVGGHSRATLDVAAATGTGTALLGKRSHASRRGATYAEMVRPVTGKLEWDVFRRLLRTCTTRKGIDFQRLGDLWDEEMEEMPALTPKSTTTLKAAEKEYSHYLALKQSVCAAQEADAAPSGHGGSSAAAAAANSTAAVLGATTIAAGAGVLPFVQAAQLAGISQLVRTAQGQQVVRPLAVQQRAQASLAAAAVPRPVVLPQFAMLGASSINPQVLAAAGLAGPASNQAAVLLQQQQQQQLLQQALLAQRPTRLLYSCSSSSSSSCCSRHWCGRRSCSSSSSRC
uniref:Uncharacterized protein n=1 Tax=Tetradesmus obliquus TaxID=3088 RepID=A0A383WLC1_TETOB|eukprot:jgi/Sobl393_1/10424/SZX78255.1